MQCMSDNRALSFLGDSTSTNKTVYRINYSLKGDSIDNAMNNPLESSTCGYP